MSDGLYGLIGAIIVALIGYLAQVSSARKNNELMLQKMDDQSKLSDARLDSKLDTAQAVTDTKLDNLTEAVKRHNSIMERTYRLEEQMKVANHRIDDLESKAG